MVRNGDGARRRAGATGVDTGVAHSSRRRRSGRVSRSHRSSHELPDDVLVRAESVTRTVSGLRILAPVSLTIRAGECTALIGENGSGKTTFLRVLLGLDEPTTGGVRLNDRVLTRRDIASVIQMPPFFENLTVLEHLVFVRSSWGLPSGMDIPYELLDAFEVGRLARHFPDELSSGERQLVALCLGLARPARLLVLDEPEQRLDEGRRAKLAEILTSRADQGVGIVLATHASDLREAVADHVLSLNAPE